MKKLFFAITVLFVFASCNNAKQEVAPSLDSSTLNHHPKWIIQGNIYEVNVRQYTAEGTFKAFSNHLQRLKQMGVQTLWFMPINPIGKTDRKGSLGSYYAVSNYKAINPEFGTIEDWKNLVKQAHSMGFKVIIDWVPNHTSADHYWLQKHSDFYVKDSTGKPISPYDWSDTRKLNYNNAELVDTMIAQMKWWIDSTNIDGFRCDVAGDVPDNFWKKCILTLKNTKDIFMLAEGDKPELQKDGFDATYGWNEFSMMKKIAKGERKASDFDSTINRIDNTFPANTLRLLFTSNHDENSWNKADYETMPGKVHAPFAILSQTLKRSIPLIYSGQEEPFLRAVRFFDKDTISFKKLAREKFYTTLLQLHNTNDALAADAVFTKIKAGNEDAVYAYTKEKNNKKILVIVNLSNKEQTITLLNTKLYGEPLNLFAGTKQKLTSKPYKIEAWGYAIYVY